MINRNIILLFDCIFLHGHPKIHFIAAASRQNNDRDQNGSRQESLAFLQIRLELSRSSEKTSVDKREQ
jgi:hypothetical protein